MNHWRPIKTARKSAVTGVMPKADLWLHVSASPLSMGISDSWRVTDCWRDFVTGKWVHDHDGKQKEIDPRCITHWMPIPRPPRRRTR